MKFWDVEFASRSVNKGSAYNVEWDGPYTVGQSCDCDHHSEIGRNDAPGDNLKIPGPYPLSDGWLKFWLAVYRLKRWLWHE